MTKSPVALAKEALKVGQGGLPSYSGRFSRRDFTQPQLFAILVLRQFFKTDYRGVVQLLDDFADLRNALHLKRVPHYSTLCYAEKRLLKGGPSSRFSGLLSPEREAAA
jgi:hypothetical protein